MEDSGFSTSITQNVVKRVLFPSKLVAYKNWWMEARLLSSNQDLSLIKGGKLGINPLVLS